MYQYHCYPDYDPERDYTASEMRALIMPHWELLCFFAQMSGYRRCVLGLDVDAYDPCDGSVPVLAMELGEPDGDLHHAKRGGMIPDGVAVGRGAAV